MSKGNSASAMSLDGETKTTDIRLAGALMSMGIRPTGPAFTVKKPNRPGSWRQFTFPDVSECGKFRTKELIRFWRGGEDWIEQNPDHPFAYTMAGLLQHKYIVDGLKRQEDVALVRRGSSVAMLPMDASAECERKILGGES